MYIHVKEMEIEKFSDSRKNKTAKLLKISDFNNVINDKFYLILT